MMWEWAAKQQQQQQHYWNVRRRAAAANAGLSIVFAERSSKQRLEIASINSTTASNAVFACAFLYSSLSS